MSATARTLACAVLFSLALLLAAAGDATAAPCTGPDARGGLHSTLGLILDGGVPPTRVTLFGPGGHYQDVLPADYHSPIDICLPEADCPDLLGCVFTFSATWVTGDASRYALDILVPTCHVDRCYEGEFFLGNVFITRADLDYGMPKQRRGARSRGFWSGTSEFRSRTLSTATGRTKPSPRRAAGRG